MRKGTTLFAFLFLWFLSTISNIFVKWEFYAIVVYPIFITTLTIILILIFHSFKKTFSKLENENWQNEPMYSKSKINIICSILLLISFLNVFINSIRFLHNGAYAYVFSFQPIEIISLFLIFFIILFARNSISKLVQLSIYHKIKKILKELRSSKNDFVDEDKKAIKSALIFLILFKDKIYEKNEYEYKNVLLVNKIKTFLLVEKIKSKTPPTLAI